MSRNSSGTYSTPAGQPVVGGTTISAATHNTLVSDIATELTDSLSRSGKGGMTAPLRTADGSVNAPAHSFTNETGAGIYLKGADNPAMAVNETERQEWTTTGSKVTGTFEATSTVKCADATDATHAATKGQLDAHISDATDAHAASAITNTPAGNIAATTVQAALNELDTEKASITYVDGLTSASDGKSGISWGTNWVDDPVTTATRLWKIGRMVVLNVHANLTSGTSATILTLPSGYRPDGTAGLSVVHPLAIDDTGVTYRASIVSTSGTVSLTPGPTAGRDYYMSVVFLTPA